MVPAETWSTLYDVSQLLVQRDQAQVFILCREGKMFGTLLGAMIIGTLLNGMTLLNVSPYIQMVIRGLVILGAVWMNMYRYRVKR
jgi:predicted ABC-type sugar transport system permease subunit